MCESLCPTKTCVDLYLVHEFVTLCDCDECFDDTSSVKRTQIQIIASMDFLSFLRPFPNSVQVALATAYKFEADLARTVLRDRTGKLIQRIYLRGSSAHDEVLLARV